MTVYRDSRLRRFRYHFETHGTRYSKRGFASRRAALTAEQSHRERLAAGLQDPYPTFGALVEAFLLTSERTKSAGWTYQLRIKSRNGFSALWPMHPREITAAHVDACITRLAADGRGARSLNEHHKIVASILSYAVKRDVLDRNVAARISKVPEPTVEIQPITKAHLQQLILAADPAMAALLTIQSQTGARFVELRRLRVAEVFLDAARPFCLLTTRKNVGGHERKRPQPLTPLAVAAITPLLSRGREYVFHGVAGARLSYDSELHRLKHLCDRLRIPRYSFHQVRHWAGYVATAGGGSKKAIAKFLGHTNTGVTERYMHAVDSELWEVAERLQAEMADMVPAEEVKPAGT